MGKIKIKTLRKVLSTGWLLIALVFSTIAFRQFVLPLISARVGKEATPNLKPPYMRLVKSQITTAENQVAVDIKVNTAGQETVEADIVLEYHPAILSVNEERIKLYDQYSVIQIAKTGEGTIDFALFSNPKRGEPTVKTEISEEARIATITFDIIDNQADSAQLELKFSPGKIDDSNLIPVFEVRPEIPTDILQTAEGLLLSLWRLSSFNQGGNFYFMISSRQGHDRNLRSN